MTRLVGIRGEEGEILALRGKPAPPLPNLKTPDALRGHDLFRGDDDPGDVLWLDEDALLSDNQRGVLLGEHVGRGPVLVEAEPEILNRSGF